MIFIYCGTFQQHHLSILNKKNRGGPSEALNTTHVRQYSPRSVLSFLYKILLDNVHLGPPLCRLAN